ncbi:hypothetical protein Q3G72_012852 [Acer saccharum]|nr:hypothetical protein Q3G72_012852 [Acer saccharum]
MICISVDFLILNSNRVAETIKITPTRGALNKPGIPAQPQRTKGLSEARRASLRDKGDELKAFSVSYGPATSTHYRAGLTPMSRQVKEKDVVVFLGSKNLLTETLRISSTIEEATESYLEGSRALSQDWSGSCNFGFGGRQAETLPQPSETKAKGLKEFTI